MQRLCRADATPLWLALPHCAATDAASAVAADAAVTETAAESVNEDSAVDEDPEDFSESVTGEGHVALTAMPPHKANLIRALALNGAFSGSELTQAPSCAMRHTVPNAWPAVPQFPCPMPRPCHAMPCAMPHLSLGDSSSHHAAACVMQSCMHLHGMVV